MTAASRPRRRAFVAHRPPAPAEVRAQAVQAYRDGLTARAILARYGMSSATLYTDLAAAGVPLRRPAHTTRQGSR